MESKNLDTGLQNREQAYWDSRHAGRAETAPDEAYRIEVWDYLRRLGALEEPSREPLLKGWNYAVSKGHLVRLGISLLRTRGLEDKRVLEVACGNGLYGTLLAQLGARVDGVDLSEQAVLSARRRAEVNSVADRATYHTMPVQTLTFEDQTFDYAIGVDCLHHIHKYEGAASELARVLKPGGVAVFVGEPLGMNPAIELMRAIIIRLTGKQNAGETTLNYEEIRRFGAGFAECRVHEYGLLFQLKRFALPLMGSYPVRRMLHALYRADRRLLARRPVLKRWCGESVIEYIR